ncbi:MAG: metal-dependent transcriptional regulator [Victivallales bacterium]|jgi:DtxR family Mn-dependent transcriptional regulator|nr:metal-dependent transcriptional regulator [Victivallales bacterium]
MKSRTISSSLEDYLEAIAEIIADKGHAHTKDIAEKLQVKMPSVTNALQALSARHLVKYQSHSPVVLTSRGAEMAAVIRHRHTVLKSFFSELLKLKEDEADETACKIEHVIGETVLSRMVLLIESIAEREDCTPLREFLAETMPKVKTDIGDDSYVIPLNELQIGQSAVVVQVDENLRGVKKFADLGLVSGTLLQVVGHAPFGDLLRIKVMGSCLSLRSRDAAFIGVKLT